MSFSMKPYELMKTNHLAVAGFLLPFVAAGVTGLLILISQGDFKSLKFSVLYLTAVPLIMLTGVVSSVKSIPLIEEKGDKDYAYSGLTLNLLFILVYITSLIYFFLN